MWQCGHRWLIYCIKTHEIIYKLAQCSNYISLINNELKNPLITLLDFWVPIFKFVPIFKNRIFVFFWLIFLIFLVLCQLLTLRRFFTLRDLYPCHSVHLKDILHFNILKRIFFYLNLRFGVLNSLFYPSHK